MAEKEAEGELGGSLVEGRTAGCWGVGPREERRAAARWVAQTVARWAMVAGVAVAVAMAVAVAVPMVVSTVAVEMAAGGEVAEADAAPR